ncbi:MAG: peptidase M20 [Chloroflexota bacterium]|jgi:acetylornithine deacetylase/succinyl-diaminopimelate desuccinylase-like protein|nr:dipeptidase [Caldilinea sp.]GIK74600.1 MAG: peptidase M20 [Chloroflexota bacterium]
MTWQTYLETNQAEFTARLLDFLRIPSISSLPEHAHDVRVAGEWVMAQLRNAGMEHVEMMETGGHPVVYADWLHAPGKPTVMIYGHFDTQPVDPLDLWDSPPFEPVIKDGRVYARGASDDKGNMLAPVLALEALLKSEGGLPVNVKCFFEGQEEIGSPTLPGFVAANKAKFACDFVLSADGGQWDEDQPALLVGLKGLCALQIDVVGPAYDVHSGLYGGAIQNPIHALAAILASMRGADGRILVDGFYDDVVPLSDADRVEMARVPFDEDSVLRELQIDAFFGEPGYSTLERKWARPTLEVNGIWGGFQGEGVKTVLPSEAHAKITCRLVANQEPRKIAQLLKAHIERHTPPGVRVTVTVKDNGAMPYLMAGDHPGNLAARDVLVEEYGKEPFLARSGGSIPVTAMFLESLGAYTVSFGFGLNDERQHSPNEFFRLENFVRGQRAYCKLLHRLAAG